MGRGRKIKWVGFGFCVVVLGTSVVFGGPFFLGGCACAMAPPFPGASSRAYGNNFSAMGALLIFCFLFPRLKNIYM